MAWWRSWRNATPKVDLIDHKLVVASDIVTHVLCVFRTACSESKRSFRLSLMVYAQIQPQSWNVTSSIDLQSPRFVWLHLRNFRIPLTVGKLQLRMGFFLEYSLRLSPRALWAIKRCHQSILFRNKLENFLLWKSNFQSQNWWENSIAWDENLCLDPQQSCIRQTA